MPMRIVGASIGQLVMAPVRVVEAAMGMKGGGKRGSSSRGLSSRGGWGGARAGSGRKPGNGLRSAVKGRMAKTMTARGADRRSKPRGGPDRRTGPVRVKSYVKHTKSGVAINVKGYARPVKKRVR